MCFAGGASGLSPKTTAGINIPFPDVTHIGSLLGSAFAHDQAHP